MATEKQDGAASPLLLTMLAQVLQETEQFYQRHGQLIKESHGIKHVKAVYRHACQAILCHQPPISELVAMEIKTAALLHDVDDDKYFPKKEGDDQYPNARSIMETSNVPLESQKEVFSMISLVSCSKNGNSVPDSIRKGNKYHLLIPRWSDRLEAVGAVGVIRCYQYNKEKCRPLCTKESPRATSVEEVFALATPERFEAYQSRNGTSATTTFPDDMMSHYYDKLLHVSCPPPEVVKNSYLIEKAKESSKELVEVCLRYGRTGVVDEVYIQDLMTQQQNAR